ncbi:MAG: DUF308 domain-containing protein [Pseudomonadota bacterium]
MADPDLPEVREDWRAPTRAAAWRGSKAPARLSFLFSRRLLGGLLVLLGFLALLFPFVSTLGATLFVGGALLAAGLLKLMSAFTTHPVGSAVIKGAWAMCYVIGGALILYAPLAGAWSLTVVLAGMLIGGGVASIAWALTDPRPVGSGWMAASGVLSILLGGMVAVWLPMAAIIWFPGVVAGVDLVSTGAAFIAMDATARSRVNS